MKLYLIGDSGKEYIKDSREISIGVLSKVDKNKHIVLIDFDVLTPSELEVECKRLISRFKLPDFYPIRTSKSNYSAICFEPMPFKEYFEILLIANCCPLFRYYTWRSRKGALRFTKKWNKKSSRIKLLPIVEGMDRGCEELIKQFHYLLGLEYGA